MRIDCFVSVIDSLGSDEIALFYLIAFNVIILFEKFIYKRSSEYYNVSSEIIITLRFVIIWSIIAICQEKRYFFMQFLKFMDSLALFHNDLKCWTCVVSY